jgi:hypothetical protein
MLNAIQPIYTHKLNDRAEMVPYPIPQEVQQNKVARPINISQKCVEVAGKEVALETYYDIVIPGYQYERDNETNDISVTVTDSEIIVKVSGSTDFDKDEVSYYKTVQRQWEMIDETIRIPIFGNHNRLNFWRYYSGVLTVVLF